MQILSGHTSPETAYVVEDYPYGFRLRCKIRYWLDCNSKKGVRFMSQTTNPKVSGEVWNEPKASTYCRFGGCMVLNDEGHVTWTGLTEYTDAAEAQEWLENFGDGVPAEFKPTTEVWVKMKLAYEAKRAQGA